MRVKSLMPMLIGDNAAFINIVDRAFFSRYDVASIDTTWFIFIILRHLKKTL